MKQSSEAVATTRRRMLVGSGAVFLASATTGCSDVLGSMTGADGDTDANWPMFRYDAANTGHIPGRGPTDEVTPRWSVEVEDRFSDWPMAVGDGTVYVPGTNALYALDIETGEEGWRFEGPDERNGTFRSPTVVEGTVYVTGRDHVYALEAETGTETWRAELDTNRTSAPTVVDGTVYLATNTALSALDAESGDEQWQYGFRDAEGFGMFSSAPAVVDGTVYVGFRQGETQNYNGDVYAVDAETGDERWQFVASHNMVPKAPAVADNTVYMPPYALDADTGERRNMVGAKLFFSPAIADGTIYVPGNELWAVDAKANEEEWHLQNEKLPRPRSPAVAGGIVYVTGYDGQLYALSAEDGEERWTFEISAPQPERGSDKPGTPPVVAGETVYVAGSRGPIYALEEQ